MIEPREVVRAVAGAWRLARLDPRGVTYFDASIEGFWRSFWAAVVVAPPYFYLVSYRIERAADGATHAWLIEIAAYAVGWMAFPVAALYLTGAFDCSKRYIGYIVAYNWASVIQTAVDFCATLIVWHLLDGDDVPDTMRVVFVAAVMAVLWFYAYFIAVTALGVRAPVAVAFVATDILISYAIRAALSVAHLGSGA